MKKVKIASSRWDSTREHMTSATTWGQLKDELGSSILNYEGSPMKAILRSVSGERNTLVDNSTLLPREDFSLLLVPEKVKSGIQQVYNASDFKKMKTQMVKILSFLEQLAEDEDGIYFSEEDDETTGMSNEDIQLMREAKKEAGEY